ncbi:unnamed protein product, partial [Mesorhabditis belari]|uniref:Uncharacterized protein n=1 Tax=Mesorhabditis belari TaxID=2138241 RepID=A0AAF3FCT9_9BILA
MDAVDLGEAGGVKVSSIIWGCVAVFVVSLMSVLGGLFLPFLTGKTKRRWFHFFIAMSVATLSADAIMHLIPDAIGVHSHGHGGHGKAQTIPQKPVVALNSTAANDDHSHEAHLSENSSVAEVKRSPGLLRKKRHSDHEKDDEEGGEHQKRKRGPFEYTEDRDRLCKMGTAVFLVMVLYFCELIYAIKQGTTANVHGNLEKANDLSVSDDAIERAVAGFSPARRMSQAPPPLSLPSKTASESSSTDLIVTRRASHVVDRRAPVVCWGIRSTAMLILLGDGVHNLIDGIAIGASFVASTQLGISTSVAVMCHELPHELGDMAILLESGLSMAKALFLNFISALTAFIGLFLGFAAVHFGAAIPWLLAITAGMFLYVAWIDMLSHLKTGMGNESNTGLTCFLQILGFLCGFTIIFLIGWFEEEIAGE